MKLFTLETADIVDVRDPGSSKVYHVNLECVAYLQEAHRKPTPNNPRPVDSWYIRVDDMNIEVTEEAFERIQKAMLESK